MIRNKSQDEFQFFISYSDVSERLSMDAGGYQCWTILRNLSSAAIEKMADTEARLQINYFNLVFEFAFHGAHRCFE